MDLASLGSQCMLRSAVDDVRDGVVLEILLIKAAVRSAIIKLPGF